MSTTSVYTTFEVRQRAVEAVERGLSPGQVSEAYGISRMTLYRWLEHYHQDGQDGLYRKEGSGRPRLLNELTEPKLKSIVLRSALEFGFESDLWTVGRLHYIITEKFQVHISKQTVWRRLVEAGLTYQKPEREYYEADDEARKKWGGVMKYRRSSVACVKTRLFCISKMRRISR